MKNKRANKKLKLLVSAPKEMGTADTCKLKKKKKKKTEWMKKDFVGGIDVDTFFFYYLTFFFRD